MTFPPEPRHAYPTEPGAPHQRPVPHGWYSVPRQRAAPTAEAADGYGLPEQPTTCAPAPGWQPFGPGAPRYVDPPSWQWAGTATDGADGGVRPGVPEQWQELSAGTVLGGTGTDTADWYPHGDPDTAYREPAWPPPAYPEPANDDPGLAMPAGEVWHAVDGAPTSALVDREFLSWVAGRLNTATASLAQTALDRIGQQSLEPGPHALLLLSAEPKGKNRIAEVHCASRLFLLGDADDDILVMLAGMTNVIREQSAIAADKDQLWAWLTAEQRSRVVRDTARATGKDPATARFCYADAVQLELLWDPRAEGLGVATSSDPLTAATTYVGVAVATLDTDLTPWVSVKDHLKYDPVTRMPRTAADVQGTAWAYLDGGVALQVHRSQESGRSIREHRVTTNQFGLAPTLDHRVSEKRVRDLITSSPPASAISTASAVMTRELWEHLHHLHTALAAVYGQDQPAGQDRR